MVAQPQLVGDMSTTSWYTESYLLIEGGSCGSSASEDRYRRLLRPMVAAIAKSTRST